MRSNNSFIFDFDSTLITKESFDEIIFLAADGDDALKKKIEDITNAGMEGRTDLSESLHQRIKTANITQGHIDSFVSFVSRCITLGMPEVIRFLLGCGEKIFILSGGFLETIFPVADVLCIPREHCFGNTFLKGMSGEITGIDFTNPLSTSRGKTEIIAQKKDEGIITGKVTCIGDGMSDANPYFAGVADEFWGFFQNTNRESVREKATRSFENSADLLFFLRQDLKVHGKE